MPNFVSVKNSNLLPHPPVILPVIGQPFIVLASVDSSNNYAMAQVRAGKAIHGTTYFALEQTAGKGQRGKTWVTTPGENIMMTVVLQPIGLQVGHQFLLSAAIALACYDFYKKYAGAETRIKWPNDIYWRDRKAAGILIENRQVGISGAFAGGEHRAPGTSEAVEQTTGNTWQWAIAGMGININQTQFAKGVRNPVSLKQITGKDFKVEALAKELCLFLEQRWQDVMAGKQEQLFSDYHAALYKLNETVTLKRDSQVFETTIMGVSPSGWLLTKDAVERQFAVGEVEWVLA